MSRPTLRRPRMLTQTQLRAQVVALDGSPSRVALAATDDTAAGTTPVAPQPAGSVGELWLYGVVGGWWWGFDAESVSNALRGMDVDELHVRIHSPGGSAGEGIAIGNLLRNFDARVVTVVDGHASSAASIIAVAGDEVVMCPGSQMMLHDASTVMYGNAADLRAVADWVDGQSQNYAGVYALRAGGDAAAWRTVMTANGALGTWYTADGAVEAGLADRVGTVVAVGSPPVAPDEADLDNEDTWARAAHDLQLLEQCVNPAARAAWRGEQHTPKPPSAGPRSGSTTTQETESAVAFSDEQMTTMRQELGLPETADEATIVSAMSEALAEHAEDTASTTDTVPDGHVVIPQARLADLEAGATAGRHAAQSLHDRDREAFLDANRTKMAPANRGAWAKEFDRDPKGTREHFAAAPVLVSDAELGVAGDEDAAPEDLADVRTTSAYQNWSL